MNLRNHSIENNVSFSRIDVSKEKPGEKSKKLFQNDWTVAAWYFPAWEKEYDWDGWEKMAKQCPWRKPLLYDSLDRGAQHHGIQYYANSNPTVIDWHIHWMCEYGINLMLWDWYPVVTENGDFETSTFQNRALETGFLGKTLLGGPPVETNRFAEIMPFAIAWINHEPFQKISSNIFDYMVDNFLQQPNYYKIDGRPLIIFWSSQGLLEQSHCSQFGHSGCACFWLHGGIRAFETPIQGKGNNFHGHSFHHGTAISDHPYSTLCAYGEITMGEYLLGTHHSLPHERIQYYPVQTIF